MTDAPGTHTIVKGDTLYSLARTYGVSVADLEAWNPGIVPTALIPGQLIRVAPPDPLQAQLNAAEAEIGKLQAALAGMQTSLDAAAQQHTADQATISAQAAQIAELEAELHPTPKPPATRFGVNASNTAQHATNAALFGAKAWRYYQQAGEPIAWPKEYPLGPGEVLVYSDKVNPKDKVAGKADAALTALFRAAPTDRPFYYCLWHEPEDDIARGAFTSADLKAAWAHITPIARAVGPHIRLTPILMNATYLGGQNRHAVDYLPAVFDVLGVDAYAAGGIGVPAAAIPTIFDAAITTAAGKPWAVGEAGVGGKVTGQARADALTLYARTAKAKGAEFVCYFNNAEWKLDAAAVAAWKAGQTG